MTAGMQARHIGLLLSRRRHSATFLLALAAPENHGGAKGATKIRSPARQNRLFASIPRDRDGSQETFAGDQTRLATFILMPNQHNSAHHGYWTESNRCVSVLEAPVLENPTALRPRPSMHGDRNESHCTTYGEFSMSKVRK